MTYLVICTVALLASGLTFFSGFGLGTLLLPAFAFFFPIDQAVALTAVVHFLNGVFKLALVGRHADRRTILRFGLPAIAASFLGAWVLLQLAVVEPMYSYSAFGRALHVTPVKLVIGLLLLAFALVEVVPRLRDLSFSPRYLPLGGVLSRFFGGLSGMQGALRSAFLVRAGLTKEAFVATGVVIGCLIDFSRLGVYLPSLAKVGAQLDYGLLTAAVLSAFTGAVVGNRYLRQEKKGTFIFFRTPPFSERLCDSRMSLLEPWRVGGIADWDRVAVIRDIGDRCGPSSARTCDVSIGYSGPGLAQAGRADERGRSTRGRASEPRVVALAAVNDLADGGVFAMTFMWSFM